MRNGFKRITKRWGLAGVLLLSLSAGAAHSAAKNALVLGDSLSAEYGLTRGSGWVALLQTQLQNAHIDVALDNASISGETTSGGKSRLPALLKKYQPEIVIIELGANDGLRGLALNATEANLRAMIAMAKKTNAKVLLIGMQIPPNYGRDYTQKFAALYAKLARETRSALVPFLLVDVVSKPELFQADRLHPTAAAQPLIVTTVWPHLKPLLPN